MTHVGPSPSHQDRLIRFLKDPASYPHAPSSVELIQTHISIVAIAPPWVYKFKKAVDFGFLDFTTLGARQHYCEEEVRLNRRLCEGLYVGVISLYASGDALSFESGDEVVEVAVKMHLLDPSYFLDAWLDRGGLTEDHLDRVVRRLLPFYINHPASPDVAEWGRPHRLRISIDENFEQTQEAVGRFVAPAAFEALRYFMDLFIDSRARLLHRRRSEGRIVDGHGDLRLEHIHCTPERVCIYDCIEFNERLRSVDVASDIAFLAMDLDMHERPDLARYVVDALATALDDPDMRLLIDFYKSYRAHVRAKVESFQDASSLPPAERQTRSRRARRYFQLALRYAVAGSAPFVLIAMGGVATGKSTQARTLGDALGWPVISSDRIRKEQAGLPLHERPDAEARQALYAPERTEAVYASLRDAALDHAEQQSGIVLDATYSHRSHREALRTALREREIPYCFVELTAPDDVVRDRLRERGAREGVVSDARLDDLSLLRDRYEAPDALEDLFHVTIDASASEDATTRAALLALIRMHL